MKVESPSLEEEGKSDRMTVKVFKPAGFEDDRIVLNFEHFGNGQNCQTSSLVRLMHHMGHDISEPMIIGISAGMGFIYWFMKQMDYPLTGGMNRAGCRKFPGIIGKAVKRLGGDFESILTRSVKKGHLFLKDTLKMNQPGLVCVDMAYLDHLLTGEDDHFGEHNFLVYGIDELENIAYISDRFHGTTTMPLTQLQQARASLFPPFPATNQMVRFSFPKKLTPLEEIIPDAILENVDAMLNPPISNAGVKGIKKWSKELAKYPKLMPEPRQLAHALMMHYIYIETGGSGGAIFRQLYADFLQEADELMDIAALSQGVEDFKEIVSTWHQISASLLPEGFPALSELREIQQSINDDLEQIGLSALKKVRKRSETVPELLEEAAKSEIPSFPEFSKKTQELLLHVGQLETDALSRLNQGLN
jgi:hypothetical protein